MGTHLLRSNLVDVSEAIHKSVLLNFNSVHPHTCNFVDAVIETQTNTYIKLNYRRIRENKQKLKRGVRQRYDSSQLKNKQ